MMRKKKIFPSVLIFFVLLLSLSCSSGMETVKAVIGGEEFTLEIADSPEKRQEGLMYRKKMDSNHGMLFVYSYDSRLSFWMKNTTIPLSIAFISKDGTIREIRDMAPLSERDIRSSHSVRYALEVNQGTFERLGVEVGDRLDLSAVDGQ